MAEYSTAQVDELLADEVTELRPSPMRWRRFGFVAAALGTVGALVGVTRPRAPTPIEEMQHMAIKTHSFMQKVLERGLADTDDDDDDDDDADETKISKKKGKKLSAKVGFAFIEKGRTPDKMKMTAHLRPSNDEAGEVGMIFSFRAKPGEGSNLEKQLQKVFDAGKTAKGAPKELRMFFSRATLASDGDTVHIHMDATEEEKEQMPPFPDVDQDMLDTKLAFMLEVGTGHDFSEIANNANGCPQTLLGGVEATMTTKLARAVIGALETDSPIDLSPEHKMQLETLAAVDSMSAKLKTKYSKKRLEKAVCTNDPEKTKAEMEGIKQMAPHYAKMYLGEDFVEALTGLAEFSHSFRSTRFIGMLPANYEIALEFENLKLAPVFKEFFSAGV